MIFINFFYIHSITWKILLRDIKSFHKNIAKILQNFQTLFQKRKKNGNQTYISYMEDTHQILFGSANSFKSYCVHMKSPRTYVHPDRQTEIF